MSTGLNVKGLLKQLRSLKEAVWKKAVMRYHSKIYHILGARLAQLLDHVGIRKEVMDYASKIHTICPVC